MTQIAVDAVGGRIAVGLGGVGQGEARLKLWDPMSGRLTAMPDAESPTAIASSRDGRWLATGATDISLRSWASPHPRAWAQEVGQQVESLDFAPGGNWLASSDRGGDLWLWGVDPEDWVQRACVLAGRVLTRPSVPGHSLDPQGAQSKKPPGWVASAAQLTR